MHIAGKIHKSNTSVGAYIFKASAHISIHPYCYEDESHGEQLKQRDPDFPLPSRLDKLLRVNTEAFPCQPCPGSSSGSPTGGTCQEHLIREVSRRHPNQMPEVSLIGLPKFPFSMIVCMHSCLSCVSLCYPAMDGLPVQCVCTPIYDLPDGIWVSMFYHNIITRDVLLAKHTTHYGLLL